MLRGVISALAWSGESGATVIHQWSRAEAEPVAQAAALRAFALLDTATPDILAASLDAYLSAPSPDVRAAACRAAARVDGAETASALHSLLGSTILPERAEAAIGLLTLGVTDKALQVLRDAAVAQAVIHDAATGWYRAQSARRLRRWTMELAWASQPGSLALDDTLYQLTPRTAPTFALCHGDLASLPFVASHTATPGLERYAGWV